MSLLTGLVKITRRLLLIQSKKMVLLLIQVAIYMVNLVKELITSVVAR